MSIYNIKCLYKFFLCLVGVFVHSSPLSCVALFIGISFIYRAGYKLLFPLWRTLYMRNLCRHMHVHTRRVLPLSFSGLNFHFLNGFFDDRSTE